MRRRPRPIRAVQTQKKKYLMKSLTIYDMIIVILLLLPLVLQPAVGFGLSNNTSPFFPVCHQHSIFSLPTLEDLFLLLLSILPLRLDPSSS
jgi:hypothetical protein